jgi:hypothetical protein
MGDDHSVHGKDASLTALNSISEAVMSAQLRAILAVTPMMRFWSLSGFLKAAALVGMSAAVAGCAKPARPLAGPDPSDASIRVPPAVYRSTLGAYRSQRPAEPGDWTDTNERVTPQPKPGQ